jgi:hypothetical protein
MERVLVSAIKAHLREALAEGLGFIVADPRTAWEVVSVTARSTRSADYGQPLLDVRLKVVTNDRTGLLGQRVFLPENGLAGFHKHYLLGYLDGSLRERFGRAVAGTVAVTIDVHQRRKPRAGAYLPVEDAVAAGILSLGSALGEYVCRHELRYLLLSGGLVSGPCLPMLQAVEATVAANEARTVLDLFSGTGALARVALQRAERVVCVDLQAAAIRETVADYLDRVQIVQADARDYVPSESFDLALLDPYYEEALEVLPPVLTQLRGHCARVLINVGPAAEAYWATRVTAAIRRYVSRLQRVSPAGHVILLGCL